MRPRIDGPEGLAPNVPRAPRTDSLRESPALAELSIGFFRRDLLALFPRARFDPIDSSGDGGASGLLGDAAEPAFQLIDGRDGGPEIVLFGRRHRLRPRDGGRFTAQECRIIRAIGLVLNLRFYYMFQVSNSARLELYRGMSEDHYVAASVEPDAYAPPASARPSRIAATIQALRMAALSTYENQRVSTGALLLGPGDDPARRASPTPPDALPYGVELTGLKSILRLCDGERTLFLVDRTGRLSEIVDVGRFAAEVAGTDDLEVPCARAYQPHARTTRVGGHACLVLSPNQEIKLFNGGVQAFAFAHGRWRILDPAARYAIWREAVGREELARALFQAALDLAEARRGGLFVVLGDPRAAVGRLLAEHDLLTAEPPTDGMPPELAPRDPLAKRALHYLARGRDADALDPAVLEALASVDGALVADRGGRLLAFGAILRHDISELPGLSLAEGARTSAALAASRFGPVLKVSQDGIVSCYLDGERAWDL